MRISLENIRHYAHISKNLYPNSLSNNDLARPNGNFTFTAKTERKANYSAGGLRVYYRRCSKIRIYSGDTAATQAAQPYVIAAVRRRPAEITAAVRSADRLVGCASALGTAATQPGGDAGPSSM